MEHSSDCLHSQSIGEVIKKASLRINQYRHHLINWNIRESGTCPVLCDLD